MTLEEMKNLPEKDQKELISKISIARAKGKTTNYSCLPIESTEILTPKGWLKFSDWLSLEDKRIMIFDTGSKLSRFELPLNYIVKEDEVIKMGNSVWSIESTKDHRWFGRRYTGRGRTKRLVQEFFTTDDIHTNHNILNTFFYFDSNMKSRLTKEESAILGWILTDGTLNFDKPSCEIYQSELKFSDKVEEDLVSVGLPIKKRKNNSGVNIYPVPLKYMRELLNKALNLESSVMLTGNKNKGFYNKNLKVNISELLLYLDYKSRDTLLNRAWLADGVSKNKDYNKDTLVIGKESLYLKDFFQLLGALQGKKSTVQKRCVHLSNKSYTTAQKFIKKGVGKKEVFCFTVSTGAFIIKQNGVITVTGNCTYGAMPPTIAKSAGVSLEEGEKLYKGYWAKNWAIKAVCEEVDIKLFYMNGSRETFKLLKGRDIMILENDSAKTKKAKREMESKATSMWLKNPLSNNWHSLRNSRDIFSTLNQSSGVVAFDLWIKFFTDKRPQLTGQMHDEVILNIQKGNREVCEKLLKDAIKKVNETLKLNRELDVDVQFGDNYAQIH